MYKVLLTKQANKELEKITQSVRKQLVLAIDELATLGTTASNTKKLQTPFPGYRKRVGDFRILYEIDGDIIIVYKVSKRSDAYR